MLTVVNACALFGLEGALVQVELDIAFGVPCFHVVGLPDTAVSEARDRVRPAVKNSGFDFPGYRIIANLAPADMRKEGPGYDLAMALGIVGSAGHMGPPPRDTAFVGELSLDGQLRHVDGVLPMVGVARANGMRSVVVPEVDAEEAALVDGIEVLPARTLAQVVAHLRGDCQIAPRPPATIRLADMPAEHAVDMADIRGQEYAKRATEVAAAGGHNLLFNGPPGSGKTLLARAMPGILPPLSTDEALETARIYSVAGLLPSGSPLLSRRPFRAPHHTIPNAGLVGGGRIPKPGEVSLSHRGALFLDELPEFSGVALEALRQPLEDGSVTISRVSGSVTYPANFMLVGAMHPCPCGNHGNPHKACTCPPQLVRKYQRRISGPLLDRMEIFVEVAPVAYDKLMGLPTGEPSSTVRQRVLAARQRQAARFRGTGLVTNADMGPRDVQRFCALDAPATAMAKQAMERFHLSARAFHRTLKQARTIADLEGEERIGVGHLAEAVQYRLRSPD
ncbi:MAG: YifB family Mg chelatase-like AAA ATPase [SAR202 cluster bacterium]|nr:YifB family Mg chelatase-like AAA ATPase [SAR202 cluster bacterium]